MENVTGRVRRGLSRHVSESILSVRDSEKDNTNWSREIVPLCWINCGKQNRLEPSIRQFRSKFF